MCLFVKFCRKYWERWK